MGGQSTAAAGEREREAVNEGASLVGPPAANRQAGRSRPRICRSCHAEGSLRRNALGFFVCFECGAQSVEAEEIAEFEESQTGRNRRSIKLVKSVKHVDPVRVLLHHSRVSLLAFNALLRAQAKALVEHARVDKRVISVVGKLWVSYLSAWRRDGWGVNQFSMVVHLKGRGHQQARRSKVEYQQDSEQFSGSDASPRLQPIRPKTSGAAAAVSCAVDSDRVRLISLIGHDSVLTTGELNITLSLAFMALALMYLREAVTVADLLALCDSARVPWSGCLCPSVFPPRLLAAVHQATTVREFFTPRRTPRPRSVIGYCHFLAFSLGICGASEQRRPKRVVDVEDLQLQFQLINKANNTHMLIYSLLHHLQLPAHALFPFFCDLFVLFRHSQHHLAHVNHKKRTSEFAPTLLETTALVVYGLKLVYELGDNADRLLAKPRVDAIKAGGAALFGQERADERLGSEANNKDDTAREQDNQLYGPYSSFLSSLLHHSDSSYSRLRSLVNGPAAAQPPERLGFFEGQAVRPSSAANALLMARGLQAEYVKFVSAHALARFDTPRQWSDIRDSMETIANKEREHALTNKQIDGDDYLFRLTPATFWRRLSPLFLSPVRYCFERSPVYARSDSGYFHHSYWFALTIAARVSNIATQQLADCVATIQYAMQHYMPRANKRQQANTRTRATANKKAKRGPVSEGQGDREAEDEAEDEGEGEA